MHQENFNETDISNQTSNTNIFDKKEEKIFPNNPIISASNKWSCVPDVGPNEVIIVHLEHFTTEQRDLFNLLTTWDLPDLYGYLYDNGIYIPQLKTLTSNFIGPLLKPFIWNKILKFENALKKWQNLSSKRPDTPTTISETLSGLSSFSTSASTSSASKSKPCSISEVMSTDNINFLDILNENHEGKLILRDINKTKTDKDFKFSELKRDALCNIIVNFYIRKGLKISTRVCKRLAEEITHLMPTEEKDFFYLARKNPSPARSNNEILERNVESYLQPQLDEEQHHQALRNDVLSLEELIFHWKGCSTKRFNYIRLNNTNEIFTRWPQYKKSNGYKLISVDYFIKYNDPGRMLDDLYIDDFYDKIKGIMKTQIKDPQSSIMLNNLMADSAVTLNGSYATIFTLLHAILKNNPYKEIIKEDGKKQNIRCSIKECQNSFIYCCATAEDLEKYFDMLLYWKNTIQPFIALIGKSIIYPEHVMLYIDGVKYKFNSFLKAMDICFKSFQIFNLKYPTTSHVVWQFVQIYFYNIEIVTDSIHSSVKHLKKQLDDMS